MSVRQINADWIVDLWKEFKQVALVAKLRDSEIITIKDFAEALYKSGKINSYRHSDFVDIYYDFLVFLDTRMNMISRKTWTSQYSQCQTADDLLETDPSKWNFPTHEWKLCKRAIDLIADDTDEAHIRTQVAHMNELILRMWEMHSRK